MNYQKHNFVSKTKLTAQALNEIEDGINKLSEHISYVTPEMYGAKHDGTTDDAAAIAQALNTGLPVMLIKSEKAYAVTSPVVVNINGACLMSESVWNSETKVSSINVSGSGCFYINCEYFVCKNVYFYTYSSTVPSTFELNGKNNLDVDAEFYNCIFSGGDVAITCNGRGLKVDGCMFARIETAVRFNYNGTTSGTGDITTDTETGGRGFVVTNNRYHSGVLYAVEVAENSTAVEMLYNGNTSDHYGAGFRICGSLRNAVISNNVFANCYKAPFNITTGAVFENITISNNEFNSRQTIGLEYCEQFFVASAGSTTNNITFVGNNFNGTKYRGIGFLNESASGVIFDSNRFENIDMVGNNITYGAICLPPKSENIVIVNNIFGHLAASAAGCCIRCTSTPSILTKFIVQNNLKIHNKDYLCHAQITSNVTDSLMQAYRTVPQ